MIQNARWLLLFLIAASLPTSLGQTLPATAPDVRTSHFQRNQGEINSLNLIAPKTAFLAGSHAIYSQDGDILHWRAIDSLVSSDYRKLAGGDNDHLFFTSPGELNSGLVHLNEWTRATGRTTDLGLIYEQGDCCFLDANHGAYIAQPAARAPSSPNVYVTIDAGKNWTFNQDILGPKADLRLLLWVAPDRLLVSGDSATACFAVDAKGNLSEKWRIKLEHADLFPGPAGAAWVNAGGHALKIELATGKTLADVVHPIQANVIAEIGPDLWIAGEEEAAVYHADAAGQWKLVKKFGYPWPPSSFSVNNGVSTPEPPGGWVHWIVAGADGRALLIGEDGQTYTWNGKSDAIDTKPFIIDNTAVAAAAQAAADKEASPEQMREMMQLLEKVGFDRLGDLFAGEKEIQKKEHLNNRQATAWLISEIKKLADSDAKNGPPPTRTATGKFDSSIAALQFFSPTSGIAITTQGIAVTDGTLDRWKGQMGWEHPMGQTYIVGATENQIYFVNVEYREVVVKEGFDPPKGMENDSSLQRVTKKGKDVLIRNEYTFTLFHWTREAAGGKLQEVRKLPRGALYDSSPAACAFADEKTGAIVDAQKLMVTRDGGVTWIETPLALKPPGFTAPERVMQIAFSDADHLVITSGGESIALLSLDKEGHAKQQWTQRIFGRFGSGSLAWPYAPPIAIDPARKLVWVCSESPSGQGTRMEAFDLADGKLNREFNPFAGKGENLASYSITDNQMYTFGSGPHGGNLLRIWNLQNDPPTQVAEITGGISGIYPVPGKNTLYLAINHQQLIEWNGKPEIPVFLTSDIRRPAVDNALLDAAEEHWPSGPDASRKESAALMEARRGLTPAQMQQLLRETQEKAKDFDNDRARVLWMTQRALELKTPKP